MAIKTLTVNVRGLGNHIKRRTLFQFFKKENVTLSVYKKHIQPINVQIHGNDNGPVIFIFLKVAVMEKGKLL